MLIRPSMVPTVGTILAVLTGLTSRADILVDNAGEIVRIKANVRWSGLEALANAPTQKWIRGWNPPADLCICQNDDSHLMQRNWL